MLRGELFYHLGLSQNLICKGNYNSSQRKKLWGLMETIRQELEVMADLIKRVHQHLLDANTLEELFKEANEKK